MSIWNDLEMANKIEAILRDLHYDQPDHFGQPYLSTYQIAIEFADRHPAEFKTLGYPLGGAGTGQHTSLAQYIARELSQRIKTQEIKTIEGAWLHNKYVRQLTFTHDRNPVEASGGNVASLSMFRIRESE